MGNAIHKPLKNPETDIRLLQLLPGYGTIPINCILHNVTLSSAGSFEALSYTWGDPKIKKTIYIAGHAFEAMGNSRDALHELRHPNQSRVLWVDAICINQDDLEEKGKQVLLMRQVYEKASEVVIWLSRPRMDAKLLPGFLGQLHYLLSWHVREGTLGTLARGEIGWNLQSGTGLALFNLLCHPYWSRIWIFQEVVMAKKLHLRYGHHNIHWGKLRDFCHISKVPQLADLIMLDAGQNMYDANFKGIPPGFEIVLDIDAARTAREERLERGEDPDQAFRTLEANIVSCARRAATVAHDKVYALLGVSSDMVEYMSLKPDYQSDIASVLTSWTESILYQKRSLHLLSAAGVGTGRALSNLPSFVPDLSSPPESSILWRADPEVAFSAGGKGRKGYIDLHGSGSGRITVRGIAIGQILSLTPVLEERSTNVNNSTFRNDFLVYEPNLDHIRYLHNWLESAELMTIARAVEARSLPSLHHMFWQTLITSRDTNSGPAPPHYLFFYLLFRYSLARKLGLRKGQIRGFERVRSEYDPAGDPKFFDTGGDNADQIFEHLFARACSHRRIGMVDFSDAAPGSTWANQKTGVLGLFPEGTRVGVKSPADDGAVEADWVYLFEGAQTPFVVRFDRSEDAKRWSGAPACSIVGECYVYGFMDGSMYDTMAKDVWRHDLYVV